MTTDIKLISVTPDAEKHMAYCARVSNPNNQENEKFSGLLKYCVKHQHWSIFEQAYMTLELNTTRGIAAQVLRHRSFTGDTVIRRWNWDSLLCQSSSKGLDQNSMKIVLQSIQTKVFTVVFMIGFHRVM